MTLNCYWVLSQPPVLTKTYCIVLLSCYLRELMRVKERISDVNTYGKAPPLPLPTPLVLFLCFFLFLSHPMKKGIHTNTLRITQINQSSFGVSIILFFFLHYYLLNKVMRVVFILSGQTCHNIYDCFAQYRMSYNINRCCILIM